MPPCDHSSTYVDCSRAAKNAKFVRPSPEKRILAMSKTGRLARGTYLSKEDGAEDEYTFPGPLVLPGDHIANHSDEEGQSYKDWFEMGATYQRNWITSRRNKLYVVNPPGTGRMSDEMRGWHRPVLSPESTPALENWTSEATNFEQLVNYLRAFYNPMQITQHHKRIYFLPVQQRKRVHFVDTPHTEVIGLQTPDSPNPFEIRYRPSPDGVSRMQMNVCDLRDALMGCIPPAAHSIVMVVDHDIYEDGEGDYLTGRSWGSGRVAIVSSFRYNPSLDDSAGIDPLHRWPASHCKTYVDERFRALNKTKAWKKRNPIGSKAFGKPPVGSALGLAVQAAKQASQPSTADELSNQWFARVTVAVSREVAHCFGLGNCTYYACLMQGVSGIRQAGEIPPYLCPVCYPKLGWELVVLQRGSEGGFERQRVWLDAQHAAVKAFCNKWSHIPQFAAFEAWLERRLEDRKGDNDDDEAGPSN
jgi:predicted Zn-dependent protease